MEQKKSIQNEILTHLFGIINLIIKPKIIVETGIDKGGSAITLLETFPQAKYYGYDKWEKGEEREKIARKRLKPFSNRVTITKIDTSMLSKMPSDIDLAFIDGNHSTPGCLNDLRLVEKYLSEKSYIIVHDMDFIPVKNAVDEWYNPNNFIRMNLDFGICKYYTVFRRK